MTAPEPLAQRFIAEVRESGLLAGVERLLVAVSGGGDSTALLLLLDRFRTTCGGPDLLVGHVHHGIREGAADADERFAGELAAGLALPFVTFRGSAPELARRDGVSLEVAARRLRYAAFRSWAEEHRLDAVALGHHREDQQETVLLRLARGTGLDGLRGMRRERLLDGPGRRVRVVRPLLGFGREEIRAYLETRGQPWRRDRSNEEPLCPRNRIRARVLPLLEREVHPGIRRSLERLARVAGEAADDLARLAAPVLEGALLSAEAGEVVLRAEPLAGGPPSLLREVLLQAARRVRPDCLPFPERAFRRFLALLVASRSGSVDLENGLRAECRYGRVRVMPRAPSGRSEPPPAPALLAAGSRLRWGGWEIGAERAPDGLQGFSTGERPPAVRGAEKLRLAEWIDEECLLGPLTVRWPRAGDRFHPLGAPGHKKLGEFFRERRLPPDRRGSHPLVASGGEIVWVVGLGLGHPFRIQDRTRRPLRLTARREG